MQKVKDIGNRRAPGRLRIFVWRDGSALPERENAVKFWGRAKMANNRAEERNDVSGLFGVEYEVLPNNDGGLMATLEAREQLIGIIRRFKPDLIFAHRTNDYHADHRATGQLVQDASFLQGVMAVCPQAECLRYTPVILNFFNRFRKPLEFHADAAVDIGAMTRNKARILDCHRSNFMNSSCG